MQTYKMKEVKPCDLIAGDTIMFNGKLFTLTADDLSKGTIMGVSIFLHETVIKCDEIYDNPAEKLNAVSGGTLARGV